MTGDPHVTGAKSIPQDRAACWTGHRRTPKWLLRITWLSSDFLMRSQALFVFHAIALIAAGALAHAADAPKLTLQKGDHVVLIGNTLAERMQYFGNFETLLHSRFPELELVVRDLGW